MALFKRENSDGSELSPFAVLLLLLLVGSIGFSLFNKFKASSEDETRNMPELDKSSISAYERIDEEIDGLKQEDGFEGKSVEEKKKIIINRLTELQDEGLITQNSITYQEDNEMIWYEWGDGYVAGIMLSDFGDGLSGNADKNSFVTKWSSTDSSLPEEWNNEINFSNQTYPYPESDIIDLKLTAKYMFGLCNANNTQSSYYSFLTYYRDNKTAWDKNHLSTDIDDYCTVDDFKSGLSGYNLVIIEEHGNYDYAKTPMICTEENVGNISQYSDDLKNRYIATIKDTSGSTCYWIYPSFFEHYYSDGKLEGTIIWLGSCHGYQNPDLANAFQSCGADAVIGFSESVYTAYDYCLHSAFVYSLMWGDRASDALNFSKSLFKYSDVDFYTACGGSYQWYDLKGQWKQHISPAKARINIKGESARLINLVKKEEQGERSIQLSVFAMDADNLAPITAGEIEMTVENSELTCTNPKQTIKTIDGSVIFDLTVNTKSRTINSKLTWHIDGYKDFTFDNYSFGTDSTSMNLCDLIFEKEEQQTEPPTETEPTGTTPQEDIHEDEDEFFDYLEDEYEDYDYGVPLEDMIAWTYHNGHLYALYDYAVSAHIMNLVTLVDPSVHLVTITDAAEQSAVEELIAVGGREIYYTGGMVDSNGKLYTINGEAATYSNWYSGCPNSYDEAGYDDVVVIYRGLESPADKDTDFGVWLEVLEDEYSYLDFFDFDIEGITRGIIIEWDNPSAYGLAE